MCLNWSKKSQKLLKQQVHDLWICLTCHVWTDRTTTTSLLPTIYYNLLLFCCLRWWIRGNSLKNKHGFSFRTFLSLLSFKQACRSLLSLNLSTAATKCYVCRSAHIDNIGWKGFRSNLWLSITETLIGNSFAVCFCTGHTCCLHFSVGVVFSANWK